MIRYVCAFGFVGVLIGSAGAQLCDPVETQTILAFDGNSTDYFGGAVSVFGNRMAIGSVYHEGSGVRAGAVYAYDFDGSSWVIDSVIYPFNVNQTPQVNSDSFGDDLDIDGDVMVIGASGMDQDVFPLRVDTGSASVYRHDGNIWNYETTLWASDGDFGDWFGKTVAIDGNMIVVGASAHDYNNFLGTNSGAAYVYRFDGASWSEVVELEMQTPEPGAQYGNAVAIDGHVIVVGAQYSSELGINDAGLVYVYRFSGGVITLEATLSPSDAVTGQLFGASVAISGNRIVVGAPGDPANNQGAAYIFNYNGNQWNQVAKMSDSHSFNDDQFGRVVAIDGDSIVVGVPSSDENGVDSGQVYSYAISNSTLSNPVIMRASDGAEGDYFGTAVAVSGEHIVVGASQSDSLVYLAGAAYTMSMACPSACPADFTGDGLLNFFDVSAFLGAYSVMDPAADFTGDGAFNFFDVSAFLSAYSAGCP